MEALGRKVETDAARFLRSPGALLLSGDARTLIGAMAAAIAGCCAHIDRQNERIKALEKDLNE